ncbi:hypothetical protein M885DRAFT_82347 [Pelagophyceae sp. CCMP2097]|nr:hypothetical protein M885DRAFT_82347 [Pelagophyceae sp. CCMP2097]|mmetsp:Transcript_27329/g.97656  ORF Transcript_27329/g.97656 Transcript_27329/m.97656 type:complete len:344 (-) Transcript_27329:127-1158(-)
MHWRDVPRRGRSRRIDPSARNGKYLTAWHGWHGSVGAPARRAGLIARLLVVHALREAVAFFKACGAHTRERPLHRFGVVEQVGAAAVGAGERVRVDNAAALGHAGRDAKAPGVEQLQELNAADDKRLVRGRLPAAVALGEVCAALREKLEAGEAAILDGAGHMPDLHAASMSTPRSTRSPSIDARASVHCEEYAMPLKSACRTVPPARSRAEASAPWRSSAAKAVGFPAAAATCSGVDPSWNSAAAASRPQPQSKSTVRESVKQNSPASVSAPLPVGLRLRASAPARNSAATISTRPPSTARSSAVPPKGVAASRASARPPHAPRARLKAPAPPCITASCSSV